MLDHDFGGIWTEKKLGKVRDYLQPYIRILSGKGYTTGYIDVFAGTGYRTIRTSCPEELCLFDEIEADEAQEYSDGSTRIALNITPAFDKYILIEKDPEKYVALRGLKEELPAHAEKIFVLNGDAKELIADMCSAKKNWTRHRAVMFLDPYGMQSGPSAAGIP